MPLTVAALLTLPVLRRGRPEVLAGDDLDTREVRWVHTSEIFEISPLLKGGEVLLTTGLGLVGTGERAQRDYIDGLAGRQIAALVLELGRTFPTAPPALVAAARRAGLPLVALRAVVPFIEVTEAVHPLLLTGEIEMLRLTERITSSLTHTMLSGSGLPGILRTVSGLAGCAALLIGDDDHVVATSGPQARRPATDESVRAAVELFGSRWGTLVIQGSLTPLRSVLAARGAQALSLELARTERTAPVRQQAAGRLLRDIAERRYSGSEELATRAAAVGLVPRAGQRVVALYLAVEGGSGRLSVFTAVAQAASTVLTGAITADLDGEIAVAGASEAGVDLRGLLVRFADAVDARLCGVGGGHATAVAAAPGAGPATGEVTTLIQALPAAQEASRLARRLDTGIRTLLASDLGVHRLLARLTTDPDLAQFIDEQLGPLVDHDGAHGTQLVSTLETYLGSGLSKTVAAERLGIRRQSLYGRLSKIELLLGGLDLTSRERRTAIDLALVGRRLRGAAVIGRRR
ncbi:PucR family transcriptional regulator [Nakamurella lactea]|uniref:PucR family transcriptional regulator n=1 Tax=Nakamurella lactea TaxID=459515 RepID=UPI000409669B|nr:PucR family transcriptional regulator [Nakamurella lactea]